jgi:TolB-like protein/DNA-binding winged helix-turn-helix (wHTH) protein/Flp pilus assembly protein TadD
MIEPSEPSPRIPELGEFQVGPWTVLQAEGTLSSTGRSIRLEPRVMDVFAYLAAHADRVVSKEELIAAVWGGAFVEEGALSQAVHSLRKALGDDARQPRYIQTIPKRGYRVIAPIVVTAEPKQEAAAPPPPVKLAAPPARSDRRAGLLLVALGVAILAVVWVSSARFGKPRPPGGEAPVSNGTRLVVLPFENIGEPGDAYFADGLTEEITKDLASLPALQVISRTSALYYKKTGKPLPEIGRELGVDYVLEGSVQWAHGPEDKPRVRITYGLIPVDDDTSVWSDSFDREVEDIFEVQAEISQRVIGRLGITLLPAEKRELRREPTGNLDAYQAYLRGLELRNQPYYSEKHIRQAVPMFERAVELDSEFAEAWAELSQTHSYLSFNSDWSPGRVEEARRTLDHALELRPDLDTVRLSQAYFTYRCLGDYETAHKQLAAAARLSPNNPEILQALGLVLRRLGRPAEAIDALERSFSLDPRAFKLVWAIAETYAALREYEPADRAFAQAISLAPDQPTYWEERAANRLAWTGDIEAARAVLAEAPIPDDPDLMPIAFLLDLYEREYERALARISAERMRALVPHAENRLNLLVAIARERLGDRGGAQATAEANRASLEARLARFPNDPYYRGYLAVALAQLGRRDEALREAEKAFQQRRNDAFSGLRFVEMQAMVDAILGRRREAVHWLTRLLERPYQRPISAADLRFNPLWDPLRGDPEFEALLRESER